MQYIDGTPVVGSRVLKHCRVIVPVRPFDTMNLWLRVCSRITKIPYSWPPIKYLEPLVDSLPPAE